MRGCFGMENIIGKIRDELENIADEHAKNSAKRFFKEEIKVYGTKTAAVTAISKKYYKEVKDAKKEEIFELCERLFSSRYMEESFIACNWAYWKNGEYEEKDFALFEKWVEKYVSNWATCDTLCNHAVGAFIEKFPKYADELKRWARSKNRWMRRSAAVSLIVPAKKGKFLKDSFEISDILLGDKDDLVQKGYGWLLKEQSRTRQKDVFDYVMKNKKKMPRTALRYAIEKMPKELKLKAMER